MIRANQRRRQRPEQTARRFFRHAGSFMLMIGICTASMVVAIWLNQELSVKTWRILGVDADLRAAIDRQLHTGQPMDFLHSRPSRLKQQLLASLPELADVSIARKLPGMLVIRPVARTPVALWQSQDSKVWLVDKKGKAYRILAASEQADLPLLRMTRDDLGQAIMLLLALRREALERSRNLSELVAHDTTWQMNFELGRRWLLPRSGNQTSTLRKLAELSRDKRFRDMPWRMDARLNSRWFIRQSNHGGMI